MKKLILFLAVTLLLGLFTACGAKYTCYDCGKTTSKAFYDYSADKERVLCEDCAREYWMPLDYTRFRVK